MANNEERAFCGRKKSHKSQEFRERKETRGKKVFNGAKRYIELLRIYAKMDLASLMRDRAFMASVKDLAQENELHILAPV